MLELSGLTLYFHKGSINEVRALSNVDLTIHEGDFITVIGSNGAGKSTLLSALAGSYTPHSGSVTMRGQDITRWPEHKRARFMGRVFQDPARPLRQPVHRQTCPWPRGASGRVSRG
jgi:putative ABC transport system ATP-binding protein